MIPWPLILDFFWSDEHNNIESQQSFVFYVVPTTRHHLTFWFCVVTFHMHQHNFFSVFPSTKMDES